MLAFATTFGAWVPVRPGREDTVDGAVLRIAGLYAAQGWAGYATELSLLGDSSGAILLAATARYSACRPGTPLADDTIDGAGINVAVASFGVGRAGNSTIGSSDEDRPGAGLGASAASLGASGPVAERRHLAVHRALLRVAFAGLGEGRARLAAVKRGDGNNPRARLGAGAACE